MGLCHRHRRHGRRRRHLGADRLGDGGDHRRTDRQWQPGAGRGGCGAGHGDLRGQGYRDLCPDRRHGAGRQPDRRGKPVAALPQADPAGRVLLHRHRQFRHPSARDPKRAAGAGADRPSGDLAGTRSSDARRADRGDGLSAASAVDGFPHRRAAGDDRHPRDPEAGPRHRRQGTDVAGRDHEGDAGDREGHPRHQDLFHGTEDDRPDGGGHRRGRKPVERRGAASGDYRPADGNAVGLCHRACGLGQRPWPFRGGADIARSAHVLRHRASDGL